MSLPFQAVSNLVENFQSELNDPRLKRSRHLSTAARHTTHNGTQRSHRTDAQRSQAWIDRQQSRIDAALKSISQGLGDKAYCVGTHFSLADIAVGCALGYLDFRFPENTWRTDYPNVVRLADKLAARQSFIDTAPPVA